MKKVIYSVLMLGTLSFSITSCNKSCDTGYEGSDCKTETRAKFLGSFVGNEECIVGNDTYTVTITKSAVNPEVKVILSNVYNQAFTATASVDVYSLTIDNQIVATGITVSGAGSLSRDEKFLTMKYSISNGTNFNTCTFSGTKQ